MEKFVKLRRKRKRDYGLLFIFNSLPPNCRYGPNTFSDGVAFPLKGIIEVDYKARIKPQEKSELVKQLRITTAHELFEILTPECTPHCNYMNFTGKYMVSGENAKKYHTKRCLHNVDNSTYFTLCPLCKDMTIYFLKGLEEAKKK